MDFTSNQDSTIILSVQTDNLNASENIFWIIHKTGTIMNNIIHQHKTR